MKKLLVAVCALWFLLSPVRAVVLLSDSFDYPNGALVTGSGGAWVHHNGAITGEVNVVFGHVFLTQTETEDVSAFPAGQPYPTTTNVLLYASFTLNVMEAPSGAGNFFAHYKAAGTSGAQAGKVFVTTNGVPPGYFRVGVANSAVSPNVLIASNLSFNTDYVLVTRYAPSNAATTLWLNPVAETDPAVTASDAPSPITTVAFALRQSVSSGNGMGGLFLDDLVVATSFSEVTSNVPPLPQAPAVTVQPQNQTVTVGDTATFAIVASGNPSPDYQWQFEGSPLSGATNSALTLTNVAFSDAGNYWVTIANALGTTNSQPATLTVNPPPAQPVPGFSLMNYNTKGFGTTDWSTNAPQVQAIGRQLKYLQPDIVTFQEIPYTNRWQMANWVIAYLPGYYLATNSATDGILSGAILSRFPITRSKSWLHSADLAPWGYTNADFTRDLFEAEIVVPGFPQRLHVFTVHLKSGQGTDDSSRRAAEAGAISNFMVNAFLTTNGLRPYLLTGDMNEDIARPPSSNPQSIQRLVSAPTGFRLTTPLNSISASELTFSITDAGGLSKRYDYIMPNGLLFSNIASSQVFRTDLLNPVPPNLNSNDDKAASDHLPVLMAFNNPYDKPFRLLSISRSNPNLTLTWESVVGQPYRVAASSNLATWTVFASSLTATGGVYTLATNSTGTLSFFRVYRLP